jgi:hypothetical protein
MTFLLNFSHLVDRCNDMIGQAGALAGAGGRAHQRRQRHRAQGFNIGSNAFSRCSGTCSRRVHAGRGLCLPAQCARAHRLHLISKLSKRTNAIIDTPGIVVFLIPLCLILIRLSWPLFYNAWVNPARCPQNAGGLIRWPVLTC